MATKSTSVKIVLKITSLILRVLLNIIFYTVVVLLIIHFSKEAYSFAYQLYGPVALDEAPGREVYFQVKKGEATMDVATKLELNRVIENKYSFYMKTKLDKAVIMPGTYVINSSMTYDEILKTITDYSNSIVQDEKEKPKDNKSKKEDTKKVGGNADNMQENPDNSQENDSETP